jgi:hypothetical protein
MPIRSRHTFHLLMMSWHALLCRLTDLALTRSSPCCSKWLVCVCIILPPPSTSRDPLSPGMSIYSNHTSHTPMMLFHVFARRLTTLAFFRHPSCSLKWLFCVFNLTSPSTFRDPLSPGMSICSPRTSHTLIIWYHAFPPPGQTLMCSRRSVRGAKLLFCVFLLATSKPISGFSASRYLSLLPRHVSHSHHLMTCIYPVLPSYRRSDTRPKLSFSSFRPMWLALTVPTYLIYFVIRYFHMS